MDFEWDEDKRLTNLAKHGIDFRRAREIWGGPAVDPFSAAVRDGERRFVAIGLVGEDEMIVAVVYTDRGTGGA
ncbi:MAG: BrnT family toxin [Allosphingosinicella sp.]|uniref:BrnT family toxin n=1 Tax=Allosphingosinicella sp. TaxID=2823234 RepID=UPI0039351170